MNIYPLLDRDVPVNSRLSLLLIVLLQFLPHSQVCQSFKNDHREKERTQRNRETKSV